MLGMKGRSFLTLLDYAPEDIAALLDLAAQLKAKKKAGEAHRLLEGKNVALVFEKTSTRTRCAFEVACGDLGAHPVYLDARSSQMGKKESIADTARVLGRMFGAIEYRGYGQEIVEALARYSGVPVLNGLTNEYHPTQALADLMTIRERFGGLSGRRVAFFGDARYNMAASLMIACAKMGMHFTASAPEAYLPPAPLVRRCRAIAEETGGSVALETDPLAAAEGQDVVYTDVWVSMGEPDAVWQERIASLLPYQVNEALMERNRAIFMHCLPAFHDLETEIGRDIHARFGISCMEVTDAVFESPRSVVFDEAENRLHTIKAILCACLAED